MTRTSYRRTPAQTIFEKFTVASRPSSGETIWKDPQNLRAALWDPSNVFTGGRSTHPDFW